MPPNFSETYEFHQTPGRFTELPFDPDTSPELVDLQFNTENQNDMATPVHKETGTRDAVDTIELEETKKSRYETTHFPPINQLQSF